MDKLMLVVDHYLGCMKAGFDKFKSNQAGIQDAIAIVMALVMIVVVGAIGIFVADRTLTAIDTNTSTAAIETGNATLGGMLNQFMTAGSTGASFVVILVIAFIGGVSIAYLTGMFGRRRR